MAVLALAKVRNSGSVAKRKGWENGYRLIDPKTQRVADYSAEVILHGSQKGIEVSNLGVRGEDITEVFTNAIYSMSGDTFFHRSERGATGRNRDAREKGEAGEKETAGSELRFPRITVYDDREVEEENQFEKNLFVIKGFELPNRADVTNYATLVCDEFGKEFRLSTLSELILLEEEGKAKIWNYNDLSDISFSEWLGADTIEPDWSLAANGDINSNQDRAKWVRASRLYAVDNLRKEKTSVIVDCEPEPGRDIVIPDEVAIIGASAFFRAQGMGNVILGAGVSEIRELAFMSASMKGVYCNKNLRMIGKSAFKGAEIGQISLNEGLQEISTSAFADCKTNGDIVIPSSVEKIHCGYSYSAFDRIRCKELVIKSSKLEGMEWLKMAISDHISTSNDVSIQGITISEDAAYKTIYYALTPSYRSEKFINTAFDGGWHNAAMWLYGQFSGIENYSKYNDVMQRITQEEPEKENNKIRLPREISIEMLRYIFYSWSKKKVWYPVQLI